MRTGVCAVFKAAFCVPEYQTEMAVLAVCICVLLLLSSWFICRHQVCH